jgi:hypothetical protein
LKPPHELFLARSCAVCCDLAADAVVRVGLESLAERRRQPGPQPGEPLPASFLKHADEQTVAGLSAVYTAIHDGGLQTTNFHDWGVIAAPRFLGRPAMAAALQRFQTEGAWGVSPHLIPHRSLHSISGTVSQALKIHGPNFGVGGGPAGVAEALLAATAMLEGQKLPGVWLVATCLDPEQAPDETGRPAAGTDCVGQALALVPIRTSHSGIQLRVVCGTPSDEALRGSSGIADAPPAFDLAQLASLLQLLRDKSSADTRVVARLDAVSRLELSRTVSSGWRVASGEWREKNGSLLTTHHSPLTTHHAEIAK